MGCRFSKPNDAEAEARRAMASSRPVAAPPARQKAMEDARLKAEYEAARANGAPNDTVRESKEGERGGGDPPTSNLKSQISNLKSSIVNPQTSNLKISNPKSLGWAA